MLLLKLLLNGIIYMSEVYILLITTTFDEKKDEKIIAIPFDDPTYNAYNDIADLPSHIFAEMRHFFSTYKQLEGKTTAVDEVQGCKEATKIISECIENYNKIFS